MAGIDIIGGFNLAKKKPLDLRTKVADQTARLALSWYFKGLTVRQDDTGIRYMYVGDETTNIAGDWIVIANIHSGNTVPAGTLGFINDIYILDSGTLYRKTGTTTWTILFNLVGSQIFTGTTPDPPDNAGGANGDIFLINVAGETKLYRKEAGVWVFKFNISGTNGVSVFLYIAYADLIDGTGYILTQSNDDTATLDAPDASKTYLAILTSPVKIGGIIAQANFDGLWTRFAGDGDRWSTVSSTSTTIGLGTLSLTVEMGLAWVTGQRFVVAEDGDPTNKMEGDLVSYDPLTGAWVGDVDDTDGAGTISDWVLSLQASSPDATEVAFSNTDVDTGTETVDSVPVAGAKRIIWDYTIVKGANSTGGTISIIINGATIEGEHNPLPEIGTIAVDLDVDIDSGNARLRATATTDDWTVKGLRRVISD